MARNYYQLVCADLPIAYQFIYQDTIQYFKGYIVESDDIAQINISLTNAYLEDNRWLVNADEKSESFLEFQALMLKTGNSLLSHNRALFHGVALLWNNYAWLITAPSGTGKTTQLRHWKRLLKKDVTIINGDKPALECKDDGTVWVYSSPWRGKEKYGHPNIKAKLGGIIILEQAKYNDMKPLAAEDAVIPLYVEFVSMPETTEQIENQAEILRSVLKSVPVWKLKNLGDEDSAILAINTLKTYYGWNNG